MTIGSFKVQALTQDTTNTYIQTNEAGGFPTLASPIFYRIHPSSQFTCDACTGDPAAVATNVQSGAMPLAPLGTYSRRIYAPTGPSKNLGSLVVKGKLVSLTINVTVTGSRGSASPSGQGEVQGRDQAGSSSCGPT